jgi:hypothetical protein
VLDIAELLLSRRTRGSRGEGGEAANKPESDAPSPTPHQEGH